MKTASEMTSEMSSGALNSTRTNQHSGRALPLNPRWELCPLVPFPPSTMFWMRPWNYDSACTVNRWRRSACYVRRSTGVRVISHQSVSRRFLCVHDCDRFPATRPATLHLGTLTAGSRFLPPPTHIRNESMRKIIINNTIIFPILQ